VSVGNPLAVRARLRDAKHVVIVGGGLTGIEVTSEIAERHPHLDVTLVVRPRWLPAATESCRTSSRSRSMATGSRTW
jgi:NADH dehydrogenase FAD-containing subunit